MPDSIFYIPPHCPHEYRATTHSWYLDWVCFDGKQALELLKEWDLNKFHVFLNCGAERMHKLFDSAYYTIKSDKAYGNYYASAQLYDMLLEYRKLSDDKFPYKSRVNSEAVAKVMKYTEENYSKPIKLADMAAVGLILKLEIRFSHFLILRLQPEVVFDLFFQKGEMLPIDSDYLFLKYSQWRSRYP